MVGRLAKGKFIERHAASNTHAFVLFLACLYMAFQDCAFAFHPETCCLFSIVLFCIGSGYSVSSVRFPLAFTMHII